jgi:hypothetical protein
MLAWHWGSLHYVLWWFLSVFQIDIGFSSSLEPETVYY